MTRRRTVIGRYLRSVSVTVLLEPDTTPLSVTRVSTLPGPALTGSCLVPGGGRRFILRSEPREDTEPAVEATEVTSLLFCCR